MNKQVLILINIVLAITASIFIYQMLPYASAVGCGELNPVPKCQPLTQTKLLFYSAMPLVLICFMAFLALRVFPKQRMVLNVLFSAVPVIAILIGGYILVLSAIQP